MLKIKSKMPSEDERDFIHKCGRIWRGYLAQQQVVVVVEHPIAHEDLFQQFYDVIKLGIDKGLVNVLTLNQVEAQHLDMMLIEF